MSQQFGPHSATILPLIRPTPGWMSDAVTASRSGESENTARARLEKLKREYEAAGKGGLR